MGKQITFRFGYVINQYRIVSHTKINQILNQFWLEYLLIMLIAKIDVTIPHPFFTHFYLKPIFAKQKIHSCQFNLFINFVHAQCYMNDMRLTHSYKQTSNQCKTQNAEISVAFCLEQYVAPTLLKSDLIHGIRIFCNDGQYTAIKIDAIWYLKSIDAILYICHCVF